MAMTAVAMGSGLGVQDYVEDRERTKGVDDLDPYVKCILLPFGLEKETEDAKDAGRKKRSSPVACVSKVCPEKLLVVTDNPDWTRVDGKGKSIFRNKMTFTVKHKAAVKCDPGLEPKLKIEAWDDDVGVDDFLGQALIPLWALVGLIFSLSLLSHFSEFSLVSLSFLSHYFHFSTGGRGGVRAEAEGDGGRREGHDGEDDAVRC